MTPAPAASHPTQRRGLGALLLTALAVAVLGSARAQLAGRHGMRNEGPFFHRMHEAAVIAIVEVTEVEEFRSIFSDGKDFRSTGCHKVRERILGELPESCLEFTPRNGCIIGGDVGARVGRLMLVFASEWDMQQANEGEPLRMTFNWVEPDDLDEVRELVRRGVEISRGLEDSLRDRRARETTFLTELTKVPSTRLIAINEAMFAQSRADHALEVDHWDADLRAALVTLLDGATLDESVNVRFAVALAAWNVPDARRWLLDEVAAWLDGERPLEFPRDVLRFALAGVVEGRSTTGGWDDLARAQRTALKLLEREGPESESFRAALREVLATAPELR